MPKAENRIAIIIFYKDLLKSWIFQSQMESSSSYESSWTRFPNIPRSCLPRIRNPDSGFQIQTTDFGPTVLEVRVGLVFLERIADNLIIINYINCINCINKLISMNIISPYILPSPSSVQGDFIHSQSKGSNTI